MTVFRALWHRAVVVLTMCFSLTTLSSCEFLNFEPDNYNLKFFIDNFYYASWKNSDGSFSMSWVPGGGGIYYNGVSDTQICAAGINWGEEYIEWHSQPALPIDPETGEEIISYYSFYCTKIESASQMSFIVKHNGEVIGGGEMVLTKVE